MSITFSYVGETSKIPNSMKQTIVEKSQTGVTYKKRKNATHILDDIVEESDKLQLPTVCEYCKATKFAHETKKLCCSEVEISLTINNTPKELYELYSSTSNDALEFQKYIQTYNNNFAFTSFGVKYDKNLCKNDKGIYTFRVQ
ncbi:hypothetical protein PanWU01x14_132070 [Parasponia andersonii]|uniref:Uncharacterized protein n=1 Tax=Parasponia andersonii TaxID=3476 RepID=A0A2P5CQG9_PARAD|nr:hypothetical protein PanWU01x14_132070 [Parasponia andersonii]